MKKSAQVLKMEKKRKTLQKEISQLNNLLSQTAKSAKSQLQQLNAQTQQIAAREELLKSLKTEIANTDEQIIKVEQELDILQQKFELRQESYISSLRALQIKTSAKDQILFILSAKDFTQGIRRARYLKEYATWQKQEAEKLKSLRKEIEERKKELESTRTEKNRLLEESLREQEKLKKDKQEASKRLKELQGKESELRSELATQKRQAKELNRQIENQIRKEIEEAARAAKVAKKAKKSTNKKKSVSNSDEKRIRRSSNRSTYQMSEREEKISGNFAQNKGRLPAPITTSFTISARFGQQTHETLKYVTINNAGIDLQGSSGAEAKAVFEGVVTRIFTLEGYNNSIIVRHGNYLTVYSNLTEVYVTTGNKVQTGQKLGKIYSDPELGGATVLHFQLWKETTKIDPLPWIRH